MLREAGTLTGSPLVVFIDGLDMMEPAYMPHTLDWLTESLPKVRFVKRLDEFIPISELECRGHTCFSCIKICQFQRKLFEHRAARTEYSDPASILIYPMKKTCEIVILAYFTISTKIALKALRKH